MFGRIVRLDAQLFFQFIYLLADFFLGGIQLLQRLGLRRLGRLAVGLFELPLGGSQIFLGLVQVRRGGGSENGGILGKFASFLAEHAFLLRGLGQGCGGFLDHFLVGGEFHPLLFNDDFGQLLVQLLQFGQLFLGLFELGNFLAQFEQGPFQRIDGGLLGFGRVLAVRESFLGFFHLTGGVVQGLSGGGRISGGLLLHVLSLVLDITLDGSLLDQFRFLRGGGVGFHLFLQLDQFLNFLLEFLQIGEGVLRPFDVMFGFRQRILQGAPGEFQTRHCILLLERCARPFRFRVAVALGQDFPRLLHPVERGLEIGGSNRRNVGHVAADQIRVVHQFKLVIFHRINVVRAVHRTRIRDHLALQRDRLLGFLDGGTEQVNRVFRHQQQPGDVTHLVAGLAFIAGGAEKFSRLQFQNGCVQGGQQRAFPGLLFRRLGPFAGRAALAVFGELVQSFENLQRFVLERTLVELLQPQRTLLAVIKLIERACIGEPGEPHADAHVRALTAGEPAQVDGHFVQSLLALILGE